MKLSLKISLVIGALSLVISMAFASISYYFQLGQARHQSELLAAQYAQSASQPSAIAAYLEDDTLAQEILTGLVNTDIIASASINMSNNSFAIEVGVADNASKPITLNLLHPFLDQEKVGVLTVYSDTSFISKQASESSFENAFLLIILSLAISIIVGVYVRKQLTYPLRDLSTQVTNIDTSVPEKMSDINMKHKSHDEIGRLVTKVNVLISALKQQFLSEKLLRESTEELQKRFRLLFEQSTAGIGLLDSNGMISIANPAFNDLFEDKTEGKSLSAYLHEPAKFEKKIAYVLSRDANEQEELDLIVYRGKQRVYLHCLLSAISESRENVRALSHDLSFNFVEVIIYDVTERREKELKARYEADHDSLTGLLNRRAGKKYMMQSLRELSKEKPYFALMMLDLDDFKPINDIHGHDAGDIVLAKISERLKSVLSKADAVCCRWGGDEFLVSVNVPSRDKVDECSQSMLDAITSTVRINDELEVNVGASIGIILVESALQQKDLEIDALIAEADKLMYTTKQNKGNRNNSYSLQKYEGD
jgi:diguanylate cyclase (GGDEF)-like protein/PAS domain S-box-containing protein